MTPRHKHDHAYLPPDAGFETICQHYAEDRLAQDGAAAPPLYQSSTFVFPNNASFLERHSPDSPYFEYTRLGNPTTAMLEAKLAKLEHGDWARCVSSGMAAIAAAVHACLKAGDHVVCVDRCYWPTKVLLNKMERFDISTTYVKGVNVDDFVAAITPKTKVFYLESPTAGFGDVPDIDKLVAAAHERDIRVIFDNSWASPYFMNPLDHGVDLVVHSCTKYISGHSDVMAGVVIGRDGAPRKCVRDEAEYGGATLDPFAAWLLLRGLRTLALRMERHHESALAVAGMLAEHPKVERVYHPGLPCHPHHETAKRLLRGYGSLFGFTLKDNSREATYRFVDRLKLFGIGVSWGGHESLVVGADFFGDDPDNPVWFVRMHVGLESTDDLIADVRQALED